MGASLQGLDAGPGELVVPDTYAFESRFSAGESSIRHTGQTARHLLISDLKDYVGGLTAEVDGGFSPAADGDVTARLELLWRALSNQTFAGFEHFYRKQGLPFFRSEFRNARGIRGSRGGCLPVRLMFTLLRPCWPSLS